MSLLVNSVVLVEQREISNIKWGTIKHWKGCEDTKSTIKEKYEIKYLQTQNH